MKNNFRFLFLFLEGTYYTLYHNFKVIIYFHVSRGFVTSIYESHVALITPSHIVIMKDKNFALTIDLN